VEAKSQQAVASAAMRDLPGDAAIGDLPAAALRALDADSRGAPGHAAVAPGRCTVVGEHVDYAGGVVVCIAVHLGVAVAVRPSADGVWRVRSGDRVAERDDLAPPAPRGDVGDLPLATVQALGERGHQPPPLDVRIVASLPEGAGLSSSAALCGATAVAVLRLLGARMAALDLCNLMLHAERDIADVPCGPLDQRAVVLAPAGGALVLDCGEGSVDTVPWLPGHVLAACHTGDTHDVGGVGYRSRRQQANAALSALGVASYRDVDATALDGRLDPLLRRRARHIVGETERAVECAAALRNGDAHAVGRLMHLSHLSLSDDYEVSTAALDAVVAAAEASPGCLGARMVGAGFGGTAVALVEQSLATVCLDAMSTALPATAPATRGAWLLRPSPGLAALAPDVVVDLPSPLLAEGVRLFNQARWFEAHEVLERAWLDEPTRLRRLYQGILQVGVGLHHARRGNLRGALQLLDRGMGLLAPFEPQRLGVDVERLVRDAATARRALAAPGGMEAFDWSAAPRVRMVS